MAVRKSTHRGFSADIGKFVKKTGIRMDVVVRKVGLDCLRGVMEKSPVDTGRFRGNWQVGVNTSNMVTSSPAVGVSTGDKMTGREEAEGTGILLGAGVEDVIYITNNLPYAVPLEYGHSKQGRGMLRRTVAEVSTNMREMVEALEGVG